MRKLLIAQHSETLVECLDHTLQAEWEIHACMDSYPVIDMLQYIKPEAVVMDLNLHPKDGLTVLEEAKHLLPSAIIATSNVINDEIIDEAERLGVGSLVCVPFTAEYIKEQLAALCPEQPRDIVWHLHSLGFNPKLSGYRCLLAAISVYASNPNLMMKEVYPDAAKLCGYDNSCCVERVIRTAIGDAWAKRSLQVWAHYFPTNRHGDIDKPTNKHFISRLSEEM